MADVPALTFEQHVLQRPPTAPVRVDPWAEWAGPCQTLGPPTEKVLAVPGSGFDPEFGSGHLRAVILPDVPVLEDAVSRLESFIRRRLAGA